MAPKVYGFEFHSPDRPSCVSITIYTSRSDPGWLPKSNPRSAAAGVTSEVSG